jgi:hypothetical protein
MHNYDFGGFGSSSSEHTYGGPEQGRPHKQSVFSLVVMIAIVVVVAVLALALGFWLLGLVFHLAGLIIKVAIVAAVAALIWRRISRRRSHDQVV